MKLKDDSPGEHLNVIERWDGGFTWMAHPEMDLQRASHALAVGDEVWLVDPVDADGLDDEIASFGTVKGVVLLSSQHERHADRLAERHSVSIHVPEWFENPSTIVEGTITTFLDELDETGYKLIWPIDAFWQEGTLYHPELKTLVVGDALVTTFFSGEPGRLELFPPPHRSKPEQDIDSLDVERILVGHGEPIVDDAQTALGDAVSESHGGSAWAFIRNIPNFARIAFSAIRS